MGIDLLQCKARLDHPFSGGALVQTGALGALVFTGAFVLALVQIGALALALV